MLSAQQLLNIPLSFVRVVFILDFFDTNLHTILRERHVLLLHSSFASISHLISPEVKLGHVERDQQLSLHAQSLRQACDVLGDSHLITNERCGADYHEQDDERHEAS